MIRQKIVLGLFWFLWMLADVQGQVGLPNHGTTKLENPSGIAVDSHGNVFVAERRANQIKRIDGQGRIVVIAGTGSRTFSGDNGPADKASIAVPETMLLDHDGNLIFCDRSNSRVRKIDLRENIITTIAGTGVAGYSGDGGLATNAQISFPYGLAMDNQNNLYIADTDNHCIRKVDAKTKVITTVAGTGEQGFEGDGGPARNAKFFRPHVVAVDTDNNLIIGDSFNQRIRMVDFKTGVIKTIAGTGEQKACEDGVTAMKATFLFFGALIADPNGDLYMTGGDHRLRKIDARTGIISTIAGTGVKGNNGLGIPAQTSQLDGPYGLAMDKKGSFYIVDSGNGRVVKVEKSSGLLKPVWEE